jgi:hypothetical protein
MTSLPAGSGITIARIKRSNSTFFNAEANRLACPRIGVDGAWRVWPESAATACAYGDCSRRMSGHPRQRSRRAKMTRIGTHGSIGLSTSRPPRRLGLQFRLRCLPAPTRSSSDRRLCIASALFLVKICPRIDLPSFPHPIVPRRTVRGPTFSGFPRYRLRRV